LGAINIDWEAVGRLDDWARSRYLKLISEIGERDFKGKKLKKY